MILRIDLAKNQTTNLEELFSMLNDIFADKNYTVKRFGFYKGKSVIVGKSFNVGARVLLKKTHIEIHQFFGSPKVLLLGVGFIFMANRNIAEKKVLQKEVFDVLLAKFG